MKVELQGKEGISKDNLKLLRSTIRKLKKNCKLDKNVVIILKTLEGKIHGLSWTSNGKHRIQLTPNECVVCLTDTLVHEWAHFMTEGREHHGDAWGMDYARCYRATLK